MNTKLHQLRDLGLVLVALLAACSGGDINIPGVTVNSPGLPGTIQFSETSFDATEGTVVNIRVTRSGGGSGAASVEYTTTDGAAIGGSDYTAASGKLTWPTGWTGNRTISIPITDDDTAEGAESFTVTLSRASWATLGPNSSATVNIIDNDTAALSAIGTITELDSVTVNGIHYDTNATNVNVNGLPANVADLKPGQVVTLEGEINFSDATGRADEIGYSASVIGPIEEIDAKLRQLVVMGQTVLVSPDTVFDRGIDPDTFAGLTIGANAQVSGFHKDDGDIIATRIEPDTTSTTVQLIGTVAGLDLGKLLFTINGVTVDYSSALIIDVPGGAPVNGMLVQAVGTLSDGLFVVDRLVAAPTGS